MALPHPVFATAAAARPVVIIRMSFPKSLEWLRAAN
jgi:hypothetical protein